MNLYLTADNVGTQTGGGAVTRHESEALKELGSCEVWDRKRLGTPPQYLKKGDELEPWGQDNWFSYNAGTVLTQAPKLCHGYAGTFSKSIAYLKSLGTRVCWTVAAHNLEESIAEHIKTYGHYPFHHMSDPALFARYKQGYLDADVLVCPSQYSADIMRRYGRTGRIEIIPHGCDLPEKVAPLPSRFTVGYLGAFSPDKGLPYLLQAWKKLAYKDAVLILAGRDSAKPEVQAWCRMHGGGNIWFAGWLDDVSDFYSSISLYVQPSATEGFGLEILEAMAHGRMALSSDSAGAREIALDGFPPCNPEAICTKINEYRSKDLVGLGLQCREIASRYTWDEIRRRYQRVWKSMMEGDGTAEREY